MTLLPPSQSSSTLSAAEAAVLHALAGGPPHELDDLSMHRALDSLRIRSLIQMTGRSAVPTRQSRVALDLHFAEIGQRRLNRPS